MPFIEEPVTPAIGTYSPMFEAAVQAVAEQRLVALAALTPEELEALTAEPAPEPEPPEAVGSPLAGADGSVGDSPSEGSEADEGPEDSSEESRQAIPLTANPNVPGQPWPGTTIAPPAPPATDDPPAAIGFPSPTVPEA